MLRALGWNDRWVALVAGRPAGTDLVPARVVRHDGSAVLVARADRTTQVHLRATTPPLAVGDWLLVDDEAVAELLPRDSLLHRRDPSGGGEQLIAANVDVVGIVCGLDRPVRTERIERLVTLARDGGAVPVIALTKCDLVDDVESVRDQAIEAVPGTEVVTVSAVDGLGLAGLEAALVGRTAAFVGESGAGKSTLLNALAGEDLAQTGAVRGGDHKGRHTTTARELHVLTGFCLIDTPGLREVGLWTDVDTVDEVFEDVTSLAAACRFRDCAHDREPGCAVRAAVDRGEISVDRYDSWREQRSEAAAAELRSDPHARHQADRRFGKVAREAQRMKRP